MNEEVDYDRQWNYTIGMKTSSRQKESLSDQQQSEVFKDKKRIINIEDTEDLG